MVELLICNQWVVGPNPTVGSRFKPRKLKGLRGFLIGNVRCWMAGKVTEMTYLYVFFSNFLATGETVRGGCASVVESV